MSDFDFIERSNYDGMPVTLYEFKLGGTSWRYASSETNISYGGVTYEGIPISDEGITQSGDAGNEEFTVSLPKSAAVTNLFNGTPPSEQVMLVVRRKHHSSNDAAVVWTGLVSAVKRPSAAEVSFICKAILASLNRIGLRLSWGRGCPHALYDRMCCVNRASYAVSVQVTSTTGDSVLVGGIGAYASGYFSGGYLEFTHQGVTQRRGIESHAENRLGLLGASDGIEVGAWITIYPGCDRVTSTCISKFNNLLNYGGVPHLPTKSPFDGDPVF